MWVFLYDTAFAVPYGDICVIKHRRRYVYGSIINRAAGRGILGVFCMDGIME